MARPTKAPLLVAELAELAGHAHRKRNTAFWERSAALLCVGCVCKGLPGPGVQHSPARGTSAPLRTAHRLHMHTIAQLC